MGELLEGMLFFRERINLTPTCGVSSSLSRRTPEQKKKGLKRRTPGETISDVRGRREKGGELNIVREELRMGRNYTVR